MQGIVRSRSRRARGSVLVLVALALVALLGFAALAIDIAHAYVTRNELQNAADAAALAGAGALSGKLIVNPSASDWTAADAAARTAAARVAGANAANGVTISDLQVQTGYWNVTGTPGGMQAASIKPGTYDKPAVEVSISMDAAHNGGAMPLFLGPIIGISSISIGVSAVAVISAPGYAESGALFPLVLSQCLLQDANYWNATTGMPVNDPATGQPYELKIGSAYHYDGCLSGQWTSFLTDANDVPTVNGLMKNGNPDPLSIGSDIWIEPGTKNSIYNTVGSNIALPALVVLPLVVDISTHSAQPIVAFVGFEIDAAVGGAGKYIQGHLVGGLKGGGTAGGGGGGTYYGAYTPPSLAQ